MKTSVYLRPPKKLLEHLPTLKDSASVEKILEVTDTTIGRAVLHIQKNYAPAPRLHRVIDSDGAVPVAFIGRVLLAA
jgi:hypothetical protein